jgi:diacylglycerol kinase (ATP)
LVILPGGTSNVLATELGIPLDLKAACALMSNFPLPLRRIDIGQHDSCYFIVGISIGFGAQLVKGANRGSKNMNGMLAYFFSALTALKTLRRAHYHLTIDGIEHDTHGFTCVVANAGNLGFTKTSMDKHINISDGLLDVVIVREVNFRLIKHIILTLLNRERPYDHVLVDHWQGKNITITTTRKQVVQCDGEMLETIPDHITVIPSAIRIVVPGNE